MITGKITESILSAIRDGISRWVNGKQPLGGAQALAVTTSAVVGLTVPVGATEAWIQVDIKSYSQQDIHTPSVHWLVGGSTPATGVSGAGMNLYPVGPILVLKGTDTLTSFKVVSIATDAVLRVQYFK